MLSSRSTASTNRVWLALGALVLVAGLAARAEADRKRIVILPFEGDEKAEKFQKSLIKLLKKSHTVVSTKKWESTADNLSAAAVSDKNIKKVAKKMKVDGVIEGTVTKRRDAYMLKLKLRAGTSGSVTASVNTKAEGTRIDGQASRDIKDELFGAIDDLESVRGGGGGGDDDDDPKPAKKPKKGDDDDDDDDEKPAKAAKTAKKPKKGDDDDDEKPAKKPKKGDDDDDDAPKKGSKFGGGQMEKGDAEAGLKTKKDDEEEDEKPKKSKKTVAAADDDEDEITESVEPGVKVTGAAAVSPANRAIDAAFGISLNARRLSWKHDLDASTSPGTGAPPNYNGVPAAGAVLDITAYPLAFGHKKKGPLTGIGIAAMYDRALLISSQDGAGNKFKTAAGRYLFSGVFRYPLGNFVVGGRLGYGRQSFQIQMGSDLPNVNYTMIQPGAFVKIPVGKLVFNADLGFQLISNTGQMTKGDQYGKAAVSGLDVALSGDYAISTALFARAGLKIERIGYKFDGSGTLTTTRDNDPEQDVQGATDMYIGAAVSIGYLY